VVDSTTGVDLGRVPAIQLVTVGQRRGLGLEGASSGNRRYAVSVDLASSTVNVGSAADLRCDRIEVRDWTWIAGPPEPATAVQVQASAHGRPSAALFGERGITFAEPQRRVAPGQAVVLYDAATGAEVLGGGVAA
jgi:tRNA-specific 2-thiouridylase